MSNKDVEITRLKFLVKNLTRSGRGLRRIVDTLLKGNYTLVDVICLKNAEITRTYLCEKDTIINSESRLSVYLSIIWKDLQNTKVLLEYGPGIDFRRKIFYNSIILMSTDVRMKNLKAVQAVIEQMTTWNVLNEEAVLTIENRVFQRANMKAIRIFLQHNFDTYVESVLNRSVLPSLFGNSNVNMITLLQNRTFDPNASGVRGFKPIHVAASRQHFHYLKFLLDRGADPNALNDANHSPLIWVLHNARSKPAEAQKCIELLLQYHADMFFNNEGIGVFVNLVLRNKDQCYYLEKLTIAHLAIRIAAFGLPAGFSIFSRIMHLADFQNFYAICRKQLDNLMNDTIRDRLTMFTIISYTGEYLFRQVNGADRKLISEIINKYSRERKLHYCYVRTLREHMRQVKNLVKCENKAILFISENLRLPMRYYVVLKKITSFLTYQDLVKFR